MLVDADDGVAGVGHNGGQLLGRLLAAPQFRLLQDAIFTAKGGDADRARRAAVRAAERKIEVDGQRRACLAAEQHENLFDRLIARQSLSQIAEKLRPVGAQQVGQTLFFDEFLRLEAGPVEESAVDPQDKSVQSEKCEAARGEVERIVGHNASRLLRRP